jgi:hypothetical protein
MVIRHGVRSNLLSVRAENECLLTQTVAGNRLSPTCAVDPVSEFSSTVLRVCGLSERRKQYECL